nr:signal peptidase I [Streptomyces sp. SID13031]
MAAVIAGSGLWWARRVWLRVEISGASMSPTFESGDRVLARRVDPGRLATGDVIVFEGPNADAEAAAELIGRLRTYVAVAQDPPAFTGSGGSGHRVIKRVAAVAGERLPFAIPGHAEGSVVPAGSLVVVGDNPRSSVDSRQHGYISADQVLGRVRI